MINALAYSTSTPYHQAGPQVLPHAQSFNKKPMKQPAEPGVKSYLFKWTSLNGDPALLSDPLSETQVSPPHRAGFEHLQFHAVRAPLLRRFAEQILVIPLGFFLSGSQLHHVVSYLCRLNISPGRGILKQPSRPRSSIFFRLCSIASRFE